METLLGEESRIDLEWGDGHVFPQKPYPDVVFLYQRMNEVTLGKVEVSGNELVLDIGCGRAIDAIELAKAGGRCSGLEPSRQMLNHAQKYIADNGLEVSLVQGTGEYLPFKTNSFDKVMCKGALDHFPHPAKAIEEMARVLKPQGKAIIAITNFESLGFRLGRRLFTIVKIFLRGKAHYKNVLQVPADHTLKFDYTVLKRLVKPHLKIEQSIGISLLFGIPYWGSLLDKLPQRVSLAILGALDKLACHLPSFSNAIVLRCSPKTEGLNLISKH